MQAHPHSESRLNAGTIAATACCYVCQHIDLSRAIEALMLMLTVLRIRVVVEVENKKVVAPVFLLKTLFLLNDILSNSMGGMQKKVPK